MSWCVSVLQMSDGWARMLLENEYLQQACSVIVLTSPSRKQALGALLDKIAQETDSWSMEKIENMQ
jgi:hypothetical protein